MKKGICVLFLTLVCGVSFAAEFLPEANITEVVSRGNDYHAIFVDQDIPNQGCTNALRVIITDSDPGSQPMLSIALTALTTGMKVILSVEGCVINHPDTTNTSPHLKTIKILRPE